MLSCCREMKSTFFLHRKNETLTIICIQSIQRYTIQSSTRTHSIFQTNHFGNNAISGEESRESHISRSFENVNGAAPKWAQSNLNPFKDTIQSSTQTSEIMQWAGKKRGWNHIYQHELWKREGGSIQMNSIKLLRATFTGNRICAYCFGSPSLVALIFGCLHYLHKYFFICFHGTDEPQGSNEVPTFLLCPDVNCPEDEWMWSPAKFPGPIISVRNPFFFTIASCNDNT